ncbi:MAG: hypothetical protein L0196_07155 [candidate division Zixibacteria bacterium]|nr:hypothetical protein [candidate division Zixibacteria bacterium]
MQLTKTNRLALMENGAGALDLGDRQVIPIQDASRELAPVVDGETRSILERLPGYGWLEEVNRERSLKALRGMLLCHWQGQPDYRDAFTPHLVFWGNLDYAGNLVRVIRNAGLEGAKLFAVTEGMPRAAAPVITGMEFDWQLHRVGNPQRELPGFALEALDSVERKGPIFTELYLAEPGRVHKEQVAPVLAQEFGAVVKAAVGATRGVVNAVSHAGRRFFAELARQMEQVAEQARASFSPVPYPHHDPVLLAKTGQRYAYFLEVMRWE